MKFQLSRLQCTLDISAEYVSVLQIEHRHLFARVVQALQSEKGPEASEPYVLWDDQGKKITPKKALLLLDMLPAVPFNDRTLLAKLYTHIKLQLNDKPQLSETIAKLSSSLLEELEGISVGLWGSYTFMDDWGIEAFLKAFSFEPIHAENNSVVDSVIRLFELCCDIDYRFPIVMVNGKSFFDTEELELIYEQAIFFGISLLMLESWSDPKNYSNERKICIDRDFLLVP